MNKNTLRKIAACCYPVWIVTLLVAYVMSALVEILFTTKDYFTRAYESACDYISACNYANYRTTRFWIYK